MYFIHSGNKQAFPYTKRSQPGLLEPCLKTGISPSLYGKGAEVREDYGFEKNKLSELTRLRQRRIQTALCVDKGLLGVLG